MQAIGANCPELHLRVNGKEFYGLLDTEADVPVIASDYWTAASPKQPSVTRLQGIGQRQSLEQSSDILHWKDAEGHKETFQPYIVPGLPVNLWGRDVMSRMGVYLYSPSAPVAQQMFHQGFLPTQGLRVDGQGIREPLMPVQQFSKAGLGYF